MPVPWIFWCPWFWINSAGEVFQFVTPWSGRLHLSSWLPLKGQVMPRVIPSIKRNLWGKQSVPPVLFSCSWNMCQLPFWKNHGKSEIQLIGGLKVLSSWISSHVGNENTFQWSKPPHGQVMLKHHEPPYPLCLWRFWGCSFGSGSVSNNPCHSFLPWLYLEHHW